MVSVLGNHPPDFFSLGIISNPFHCWPTIDWIPISKFKVHYHLFFRHPQAHLTAWPPLFALQQPLRNVHRVHFSFNCCFRKCFLRLVSTPPPYYISTCHSYVSQSVSDRREGDLCFHGIKKSSGEAHFIGRRRGNMTSPWNLLCKDTHKYPPRYWPSLSHSAEHQHYSTLASERLSSHAVLWWTVKIPPLPQQPPFAHRYDVQCHWLVGRWWIVAWCYFANINFIIIKYEYKCITKERERYTRTGNRQSPRRRRRRRRWGRRWTIVMVAWGNLVKTTVIVKKPSWMAV